MAFPPNNHLVGPGAKLSPSQVGHILMKAWNDAYPGFQWGAAQGPVPNVANTPFGTNPDDGSTNNGTSQNQQPWTDKEWSDLLKSLMGNEQGDPKPLPGSPSAPATEHPTSYGHPSTLTPEQAAAFQMMMLIQGHTGDTVGRGRVIPAPGVHAGQDPTIADAPAPLAAPAPSAPNTGREQVAGA